MQQEQFKKEIVPLRGQLMTVAARMLKNTDDAEDVVQETLLKLWTMRERLPEIQNITALSVQITKNACLNKIKVQKRQTEKIVESTLISGTANPHTQLEESDSLQRTMRIIEGLPDTQQAILRMRHIEGLEMEEIAELTGSTPEAIRMNLSRARRRVKEIFFKTEK